MHYTSWDRGDRDRPRLLAEDGPLELAKFDPAEQTATVAAETWQLNVTRKMGAGATLEDGRVFRAAGDFSRDKVLNVSLNGRTFTLVNENKNDWIIDDNESEKVAQFTGSHNGVRRAILEFEGDSSDYDLSPDEIVALSWFARLALESRMERSSTSLIVLLVILSVAAVLAFIL